MSVCVCKRERETERERRVSAPPRDIPPGKNKGHKRRNRKLAEASGEEGSSSIIGQRWWMLGAHTLTHLCVYTHTHTLTHKHTHIYLRTRTHTLITHTLAHKSALSPFQSLSSLSLKWYHDFSTQDICPNDILTEVLWLRDEILDALAITKVF